MLNWRSFTVRLLGFWERTSPIRGGTEAAKLSLIVFLNVVGSVLNGWQKKRDHTCWDAVALGLC